MTAVKRHTNCTWILLYISRWLVVPYQLKDGTIVSTTGQREGTQLPQSTDRSSFARFTELCEAKGIKVVLDMVVNHAGYGAQANFDASWFNHGSGDIKGELAGLPDFNHYYPDVLDFY